MQQYAAGGGISPMTDVASTPPPLARWLGFAGLLPQILAVILVLPADGQWRFTALALGYAYAALILSFLGGMWWGLAARASAAAPGWLWFAAVAPSLIALLSAVPWATGEEWPGPSLGLLGIALLGSLLVDRQVAAMGLSPAWWLGIRVPLSIGLGLLTLAIACLA